MTMENRPPNVMTTGHRAREVKATLAALARRSPAFFAAYVLRDDRTGRVLRLASQHEDWHRIVDRHDRVVLWAHTESGKTTQMAIARVLWQLGTRPGSKALVLTSTPEKVARIGRTLAHLIAESPELRATFPDLVPTTRKNETWKPLAGLLTVERPIFGRDVSVAIRPLGATVPGIWFDLVVIDGVLTRENSHTIEGRALVYQQLQDALKNRLGRQARVVLIDTAHHPQDALHLFAEEFAQAANGDPRLWRFPARTTKGALAWPEAWPEERLVKARKEWAPTEYKRALLCEVSDDNDYASPEAAVLARRGADSFSEFVKQAWQYVPGTEPLTWGWHLDALCNHYEAVVRGDIPRLLVNCPPGHAKSVLLAVLLPAWVWSWWPRCQMLAASYSGEFVQRDSMRCRAVIESDWYRDAYSRPGGWTLRADQNAKTYFVNTLGGERRATSVGGAGAGIRAHLILIDDPLNIGDAHSKAARHEANTWIGQTLSQRFIDSRKPKTVLIMQRLHEDDPSGFVLAGGGWEHLCLPSEYDPERQSVTHKTVRIPANGAPAHDERIEFWRDPRTDKGELLSPERFPREVLDAARRPNALGEQGYASQHDQRPRPAGGGLFKIDWWRFWKPDGRVVGAPRPRGTTELAARLVPDRFDRVIISVDANFRDKAGADPVSILVIGLHKAERYVLERVSGPLGFTKTVAAIKGAVNRQKLAGHRLRGVLVEARANGDAIIETIKDEVSGVIGIEPEGGKEARAWALQPYVEAGNLYLPEGAPWLDEFIEQFASFPNAAHDDDVDALSQAIIHIEHAELTTAQRFGLGA